MNLLNNWLNGDSSSSFCEYLSRNTEKLKSNRVPGGMSYVKFLSVFEMVRLFHELVDSGFGNECAADTWPFLVTLLIRCVSLEVSTSKRHAPRLIYAKALRNVVKKAGDYSDSG